MSVPEVLSIVLLVSAFGLAMWRDVNVGLVVLPAAFVMSVIADIPKEAVLAGFPADLVVLILGVMYMFGHAQRSGAIDRLVHLMVGLSRGRDWFLPWSMFLVAAALSAIGTLPSATVAVVLPMAMRIARTRGIDPVLMAVVACGGAGVGGFSPLSPWGALVKELAGKLDVAYSPAMLFAGLAALNLVLALIAFFALGGVRLVRDSRVRRATAQEGEVPVLRGAAPATPYETGSLIGLGVFVIVVLGFGVSVSFVAFLTGLILQLVFRPDTRRVVAELPWSVVLLTSGIMVYVGVLERTGTLKALSGHLGGIDNTLLAVLAVSYLAALFATVESSTVAVLGVVVPLAAAVLPHADRSQFTVLLIAVCATIGAVAISPLHLGGGLILANTEEADTPRVFRRLMAWSVGAALVLPPALLVLPLATGL
ncbi:SLC13 family permease [Streptomyces sp. NBC_01361]|uniref:SLC13 family permease n=1 Tax=Streptomyces sp. NBC_01361 TaxID=2903838 RepID=UPI002E310DB8|nr:SLC13 family permease [Streptomyces sp. NBC_01361]